MIKWLLFSPVALAAMLIARTLGLVEAPKPEPAMSGTVCEFAAHNDHNVLGEELVPCPSRLSTGFERDGYCRSNRFDRGQHVVCAQVTDEFLAFTKSRGNDLSTPRPGFEGLQAGDGWCLCAERWREALEAGVAPPIVPDATDQALFQYVPQSSIEPHALRSTR